MLRVSRGAPGPVSRRLNLARNGLRKIGLQEIVAARRRPGQIVLVDNEGVLQAAHNLFVHAVETPELDRAALAAFLRLAPLPEAVVYVRQPAAELVARTLQRGHKRVQAGSAEAAERFVRNAVDVFDAIAADASVRARLLFVDPGGRVSFAPAGGWVDELVELHVLVEAGASVAAAERRRRGCH
jgi:hypothetical protein